MANFIVVGVTAGMLLQTKILGIERLFVDATELFCAQSPEPVAPQGASAILAQSLYVKDGPGVLRPSSVSVLGENFALVIHDHGLSSEGIQRIA